MAGNFEIQVSGDPSAEDGGYTIAVASLNDFTDGAFRVQPPIAIGEADLNAYIGYEEAIVFDFLLSGAEATRFDFRVQDAHDLREGVPLPNGTSEERVLRTAQVLASYLSELASKDYFISRNISRNGE